MKISHLFLPVCFCILFLFSCKSDVKQDVTITDDKISTQEAPLKKTPVKSNGVSTSSLMAKAMNTPDAKTFTRMTLSAGITDILVNEDGPYTVFAPSNTAFSALPKATTDHYLTLQNKAALATMLQNHIIAESIGSAALLQAIKKTGNYNLKTVGGATLSASLTEGGNIQLTDANGVTAVLTKSDILAANGVLHVINTVLASKIK